MSVKANVAGGFGQNFPTEDLSSSCCSCVCKIQISGVTVGNMDVFG